MTAAVQSCNNLVVFEWPEERNRIDTCDRTEPTGSWKKLGEGLSSGQRGGYRCVLWTQRWVLGRLDRYRTARL